MTSDDPFDAFRAAYPARVPNPWSPARTIFDKLIKTGVSAADLVVAAKRYAAECAELKIAPDFIPHARTWLSQRRFEDYSSEQASASVVSAVDDLADDQNWHALKGRVSRETYKSWIRQCAISIEQTEKGERCLRISGPSRYIVGQVRQRWDDALREAFGVMLVIYRWPGGAL